MADQPHTVVRSAFSFLSGTLLSRVGGLVRDMATAFVFGTSASIAAFLVAFRLANLLRRIFGEGALLNGFVPHFESARKKSGKEAATFFRDTFCSILVVVLGVIGMVELGSWGWEGEVAHLVRIILPGALFICLFSVCSGLLHCEKWFFLTGIAPVAFNLVWIGSVWVARGREKAVVVLAVGVVVAFIGQWLVTVPKTVRFLRENLSWREMGKVRLFSPEVRQMMSSLSYGIVGVTAAQINTALDTVFARYASIEGPAYLNYAIHLQQLPLALFGIGISSALLPPLSRAVAEEGGRYRELLEFSLRMALFLVIPCTVAIFVVGGASVNLIFGRGNFGIDSTIHTTYCLWGYGLGLIPMVITLLLAPGFYARRDYRTPMRASLVAIGINVVLNVVQVFVLGLGAESLAISTSLAAACNAWILARKSAVRFMVGKSVVGSLVAGVVTWGVGWWWGDPTIALMGGRRGEFVRELGEQIWQFVGLAGVFVGVFVAMALLCRSRELIDFRKTFS